MLMKVDKPGQIENGDALPAGLAEVGGPRPEIQLYNGAMFSMLEPDPHLMTADAIAVGLANLCRFCGQIDDFYSNAQHSVLVALLAPNDMPSQRYAILHDADEAFGLTDMATPYKKIFPDFSAMQKRAGRILFDFHGVDHRVSGRMKHFDRLALAIEKRDLKYEVPGYIESGPDPIDAVRIDPLLPREARELFLRAFNRIFLDDKPVTAAWLPGGFHVDPDFRCAVA